VPKPSGTTLAVVAGPGTAPDDATADESDPGTVVIAAVEAGPPPSPPPPHATTDITSGAVTRRDRHRRTVVTVGVSVAGVPVTCESCGATEDELHAVHRRYVTPAEWDTPGREVTLDEVERWCYSCLTHYPHVLVDG